MQMAISSYMTNPFSGNNYIPYTYDYEKFSTDNESWELQFVTRTLKTHNGQCRSLPWMYNMRFCSNCRNIYDSIDRHSDFSLSNG